MEDNTNLNDELISIKNKIIKYEVELKKYTNRILNSKSNDDIKQYKNKIIILQQLIINLNDIFQENKRIISFGDKQIDSNTNEKYQYQPEDRLFTKLSYAVIHRQLERVQNLLSRGYNPLLKNIRNDTDDTNAFIVAIIMSNKTTLYTQILYKKILFIIYNHIVNIKKLNININISGPISFTKLKINLKNEKQILLFGDSHSEYKTKELRHIPFIDYLKYISSSYNNQDNCLDIYTESLYNIEKKHGFEKISSKNELNEKNGGGNERTHNVLLHEVRYEMSNNINIDTKAYKIRKHNFEITQCKIGSTNLLHPVFTNDVDTSYTSHIESILEDIFINDPSSSSTEPLYIFKDKATKLYNYFIYSKNESINVTKLKEYITYVNSIQHTNIYCCVEQIQFISSKILKQIQQPNELTNYTNYTNILSNIVNLLLSLSSKYISSSGSVSSNSNTYFSMLLDEVRMLLMETYAFLRMFRIFEPKMSSLRNNCRDNIPQKNIIYFGGENHTNNMIHLFLNIKSIIDLPFSDDSISIELISNISNNCPNFDEENNRVLTIPSQHLIF